jgi:hypothetical protein
MDDLTPAYAQTAMFLSGRLCVRVRFGRAGVYLARSQRGAGMTPQEFKHYRARLKKTQQQMALLLGTSIKAIHSYEQGWRQIPPAVERQMLFLLSRVVADRSRKPCWKAKGCSLEQRKQCPAYEFNSGDLCWFVNGRMCCGIDLKDWREKMKLCRSCEVLGSLLERVNASE